MNFEKVETDIGMKLARPGEEMLAERRQVTVVGEIYVNPCEKCLVFGEIYVNPFEKCLAEEKKPERACGTAHRWASAEVIHPFQEMPCFDDLHWENPLPWLRHCFEASVAPMQWYC